MSSGDSAPDPPVPVAAVVPLVPAWRVDRTFDYLVPDPMTVEPGSLVRVPFGGRRVRAVVVEVGPARPDRELQPIAAVVFPTPVATPSVIAALRWIGRRYVVPAGRAFGLVVPPRVRIEVKPAGPGSEPRPPEVLPSYRGGQRLLDALAHRPGGSWLLRTRPGEDLGAVVSELVAATGGRALVAVPEVRFGSAVLDTLASGWPGLCRVDTAVDEGTRARSWARLAAGGGPGAGGRAAVLAPGDGLSLVVVDEQHPSFKEDRAPRYHARAVALERARLSGAACVLVSATPSVEIGASVLRGELGAAEPSRAQERAGRPIVETVEPPQGRAIGHLLHERIRDVLRAGGRVALLVPGRGYARALWCARCRRSVRCPVCEAGLFFDRSPARVRCVRCGFADRPPDRCPHCGAADFRFVGAGSERIAEQIAAAFPRARVARMDTDILVEAPSIERSTADIYVTTWIGTKTALRPDVSMVAVLDADWLIRRPDFRAAERAYQALAEMSEWAGPGGRLVVHTSEPRHHAIQAVVRADYRYFLERELEARRELSYPPFSELVAVSAEGEGSEGAIEAAARACRAAGAIVLGPIPARERSAGWRLLAKCPDVMPVADALRELVVRRAPPGARMRIDVDPQ